MNSSSFHLSENVFIYPSFLKEALPDTEFIIDHSFHSALEPLASGLSLVSGEQPIVI